VLLWDERWKKATFEKIQSGNDEKSEREN